MLAELEEWKKEHGSDLTIGSEVVIKESCEYFEPRYDFNMKQKVVMLYMDSGGLNIGINEAVPLDSKTRDSYICETDGYRIHDLKPAPTQGKDNE